MGRIIFHVCIEGRGLFSYCIRVMYKITQIQYVHELLLIQSPIDLSTLSPRERSMQLE